MKTHTLPALFLGASFHLLCVPPPQVHAFTRPVTSPHAWSAVHNDVATPPHDPAYAPHRSHMHRMASDASGIEAEDLLSDTDTSVGVHIMIIDHLDFTTIAAEDSGTWARLDFDSISHSATSIRGNCSLPPPDEATLGLPPAAARLRPFLPGQCLIVTDGDTMYVSGTELWLDNIYVRLRQSTREQFEQFITVANEGTQLWITNSTFQGDGNGVVDCTVCGIEVAGAAGVYVEGCTFADFDGLAAAYVSSGATSSFLQSTFVGNTIVPHSSGAAVIEAEKSTTSLNTEVRLEQCTFANNTATLPVLLADNRDLLGVSTGNSAAVFYSDDSTQTVCVLEGNTTSISEVLNYVIPCNSTIAPLGLETISSPFRSASDDAFVRMQQDVAAEAAVPVEASPGDEPDISPSAPREPPPVANGDTVTSASPDVDTAASSGTAADGETPQDAAADVVSQIPPTARDGAPVATDTGTEDSSGGGGISRGAVIGIAVGAGCLMLAVVLALLAVRHFKRRRRLSHSRDAGLNKPGIATQPQYGNQQADAAPPLYPPPGGYAAQPYPPAQAHQQSPPDMLAPPNLFAAPGFEHGRQSAHSVPPHGGASCAANGGTGGHSMAAMSTSTSTSNNTPGVLSATTTSSGARSAARSAPQPPAIVAAGGSPLYSAPNMHAAAAPPPDPFGSSHAPHPQATHAHGNPAFQPDTASTEPSWAEPSIASAARPSDTRDTFDQMSLHQTCIENPHRPRTEPPVVPGPGAARGEVLDYIKQQLDCYGKAPLLIDRFELLGPNHRATGDSTLPEGHDRGMFPFTDAGRTNWAGQGVVQFARRVDGTGISLFALKFFAARKDFEDERKVYRTSPLRHFMPSVARVVGNEDRGLLDPFGRVLPPFIVMEKGESLQERARNSLVDLFTAAQVLGHVSQRIADLHKTGYVHRDLKPGNIMWQPRTYTWVLIDFGLAARIGEAAAVGCTPGYAAPEMALAYLQGVRRVAADDKVDSWALGVIAFELLLQRPAFGMFQGVNDIYKQLTSAEHALPWEEARLSAEDKSKLGKFRQPLLQLLRRDPAERASALQFCKQMFEIFSNTPGGAAVAKDTMPERW